MDKISGSSFKAPKTHLMEQDSRLPPLTNLRSFNIISNVFKIALFALIVLLRKAMFAVKRNPIVTLRYLLFSIEFNDNAPWVVL